MLDPLIVSLPDGRRHLCHGPIDLVIEAWGAPEEVAAAHAQAQARFPTLLPRLVEELALLRRPVGESPAGPIAQRMRWACLPFSDQDFITPMAAVAGAVADEMLAIMLDRRRLEKIVVNNGGDIAFHLAPGARFSAELIANDETLEIAGRIEVASDQRGRGLATSGRGGRSLSLGIADAVTVLADTAAAADAAATLIANAVDCPSSAVHRAPANSLDPDSDLGDLPAVVRVGPLRTEEVDRALAAGVARAELFKTQGLIEAAVLSLRGERRLVGAGPLSIESVGSLIA